MSQEIQLFLLQCIQDSVFLNLYIVKQSRSLQRIQLQNKLYVFSKSRNYHFLHVQPSRLPFLPEYLPILTIISYVCYPTRIILFAANPLPTAAVVALKTNAPRSTALLLFYFPIYQRMGNTTKSLSSMQVLRHPQPGQWTQIGKSSNYQIAVNSQLGIESQQYTIPKDTRISQLEDFQIYEFRCVNDSPLVRVYNVEKIQSNDNRGMALLRVRTERIPVRLSELKALTFQQALYVFREALNGYREIVRLHGPVAITERMIGFNGSGKVKVWINENYAKNTQELRQGNQQVQQLRMAELIAGFVARHMHNGTFPPQFKAAYGQTPHTFDGLLQLISVFIQRNRLGVPDKLNLIPKSSTPGNLNQKPIVNTGMPGITHSYSQQALNSQSRTITLPTNMSVNGFGQVQQKFVQPRRNERVSSGVVRAITPTKRQNSRSHVQILSSPIQGIMQQPATMVLSDGRIPPPSNAVSRVTVLQHQQHHQPTSLQLIPQHPHTNYERNLSPRMVAANIPHASIVESIVSAPNLVTVTSNRPKTMQPMHRPPPMVHQNRHIIKQSNLTVTPVITQTANHQLIVQNRSADRFQYPRSKHIDLRNAKLLAYSESQYLGQRARPDVSPHVIFVPADSDTKKAAENVQRRSTVALNGPRAKSEFMKSMVSEPRNKSKRGIMTLYESRHRELRGQPILHQGYDEFMRRMKTGERPKSTLVRLSYAGRPGPTVEKKPAIFAAEKIVTSQTTVEKSPKKRYVSADPVTSMSPSKNQLNQKNPRLIKFPIKKQVTVTGYGRTSFEQDLEPILKQPKQPSRTENEIPAARRPPPPPARARQQSPQETPIKVMTNSVFSANKPAAVPNPESINVDLFNGVKTSSLKSSNVKINMMNPPSLITQPQVSPRAPQISPRAIPQAVPIEQPTVQQQVRSKIQAHIQQLQSQSKSQSNIQSSIQSNSSSYIQSTQPLPSPKYPTQDTIPSQTVIQKSHISSASSHNTSGISAPAYIPEPSSRLSPVDGSLTSSDQIMKIVEESKKYRAGASAHLQEVKGGLKPRKAVSPTSKTSDTGVPSFYNHQFEGQRMRYNMSASDDFSSLRPQTLFEPKPESNKQSYHQPPSYAYQPRSVPPHQMKQSQPISRSYMNTGSHLEYTASFKGNSTSPQYEQQEIHYQRARPQVDLTSTFGVHQNFHQQQDQYPEEEEMMYYHNGAQQVEISYNKKDYEPVEYGEAEELCPTRNLKQQSYSNSLKDHDETEAPSRPESNSYFKNFDEVVRGHHRRVDTHITEQSDNAEQYEKYEHKMKLPTEPSKFPQKALINRRQTQPQPKYSCPAIPFLPTYSVISKALGQNDKPSGLPTAGGPISPLKGISGYVPSQPVARYTPIIQDEFGFMSQASERSHILQAQTHRQFNRVQQSMMNFRKQLQWDAQVIYPKEINSARNSNDPRSC